MSGLKRKTALRPSAIDAEKALRDTPRRKTPLARKRFTGKPTPRAAAKRDAMKAARILLAVRDGLTCRLTGHSPCAGLLDPHHLLKASAGGREDIAGLVWLCRLHNGWVEDQPDRAHELGLVVRFGDTLDDAWRRMFEHGLATRPEPSPRPRFPYTGSEDARCEMCDARGWRHLCPACVEETSVE